MRFSLLVHTTFFLRIVHALLIPPAISEYDLEVSKTISEKDAVAMERRMVQVNCHTRPAMTKSQEEDQSSKIALHLNFTVLHDDVDYLLLNGHQIYPVDLNPILSQHSIIVPQINRIDQSAWKFQSSGTLGIKMNHQNLNSHNKRDQLSLVIIKISMLQVSNVAVDKSPVIHIELISTSSGKFMIQDIRVHPSEKVDTASGKDVQRCASLSCEWQATVANFITSTKSALRSHHFRQYSRLNRIRQTHRQGNDYSFLNGIFFHVIVPILIGGTVGILASVLGVFIVQMALYTWKMLFRRKSDKNDRVYQQENWGKFDDVQDLETQSLLPSYTEIIYEKDES
ncbi:BgTH12-02069 [Blumeria graminis f. sp. triticale]|uniref:Bgt-4376 n=3 Tax=Blumeria graminis TaxID=34373 RepID=A0A381L2S7_BLUGR|nr:hypothetical protein BGT96224_4376 [Blumeria graminis f. sp. tritici 96224]CAD6501823.1 BgTH12-02069 [Blumeria graminis f. sp. triticale]VDB85680.1 Bgt-4376 [Blumeria graminis f. sp. tritici]